MAGIDWLTAQPIAHRGLHDCGTDIVENTPSAVAAAIEAGYAVELDVQPAADGEAVVFHDETVERLTTGSGRVSGLTPRELAGLRFRAGGDRIPTLQQILELAGGRTPLVIEVKTDWTGMEDFCARIAKLLHVYAGPVAVMSFDPLAVDAFRRHAPALPRGIVADPFHAWRPGAMTRSQAFSMRHLLHAGRTKPHFIAYGVEDLPAPAPLALRALFGMPLLTWTVRSQEQRKRADRWASQMIFEGFRP